MAFGLSGAPASFQGAMNTTLAPILRKFALVFFDDILLYSRTWEDHLNHLSQVLQLLLQDQWHIKLSKCAFAQQQIAYLGHVISSKGVSTDPNKAEAVKSWPVPTNSKELRGFLGLAGYYRKFVRHFGMIAKPLTTLLKKGVLFVWTHDHTVAFDTLKQSLCSAPVLALPNFEVPFAIEVDASGVGVGVVLLQEGHPLAFVSKALGPKNQGLSVYEKEYLAIILAVTQWRQYLLHAEFLIFIDHRSLSHLTEQKLHTPWQQRVFSKLLGLQYRVVYKKGIENGGQMHCLDVPIWMQCCLVCPRLCPNGYCRSLTVINRIQRHNNCCLLCLSLEQHLDLIRCNLVLFDTKEEYGWEQILVSIRQLSQPCMIVLWVGIRAFLSHTAESNKHLHGLV
jgi:hypothetical protein